MLWAPPLQPPHTTPVPSSYISSSQPLHLSRVFRSHGRPSFPTGGQAPPPAPGLSPPPGPSQAPTQDTGHKTRLGTVTRKTNSQNPSTLPQGRVSTKGDLPLCRSDPPANLSDGRGGVGEGALPPQEDDDHGEPREQGLPAQAERAAVEQEPGGRGAGGRGGRQGDPLSQAAAGGLLPLLHLQVRSDSLLIFY